MLTTITSTAYAMAHRSGQFACFERGCIATPRPRSISEDASNAIERTRGRCGSPSALPVCVAREECWLRVTDPVLAFEVRS